MQKISMMWPETRRRLGNLGVLEPTDDEAYSIERCVTCGHDAQQHEAEEFDASCGFAFHVADPGQHPGYCGRCGKSPPCAPYEGCHSIDGAECFYGGSSHACNKHCDCKVEVAYGFRLLSFIDAGLFGRALNIAELGDLARIYSLTLTHDQTAHELQAYLVAIGAQCPIADCEVCKEPRLKPFPHVCRRAHSESTIPTIAQQRSSTNA